MTAYAQFEQSGIGIAKPEYATTLSRYRTLLTDLLATQPECSAPLTSVRVRSKKDLFMRKPMMARSTPLRLALFAGAAIVGACSGDVTMPTASTPAASIEAASRFVPTDAQKALVGVKDGNYSFTIDPRRDQVLTFGANRLELPANSVCDLETSGYGVGTWNRSCKPESSTLKITVVIKNASSDNPRIDFYPAMRFNPTKDVELFMYVPKVNKHDAKDWIMIYCPDKGKCYDESTTDASLVTSVDKRESMLFRRIKHFSGYLGAGRGEEEVSPDVMQ